jgi:hypothetical protein
LEGIKKADVEQPKVGELVCHSTAFFFLLCWCYQTPHLLVVCEKPHAKKLAAISGAVDVKLVTKIKVSLSWHASFIVSTYYDHIIVVH